VTDRNDNFMGRRVSAEQLAEHLGKSEWFRRGYEGAMKNEPFDSFIEVQHFASQYERGRAFAFWSRSIKAPLAVWRKGVAAKTVRERLAYAMRMRAVI